MKTVLSLPLGGQETQSFSPLGRSVGTFIFPLGGPVVKPKNAPGAEALKKDFFLPQETKGKHVHYPWVGSEEKLRSLASLACSAPQGEYLPFSALPLGERMIKLCLSTGEKRGNLYLPPGRTSGETQKCPWGRGVKKLLPSLQGEDREWEIFPLGSTASERSERS